jgi:hypothetical protein
MRKIAILGSFDGLTTALGMILSLAITGNFHGLAIAAVALAVGAAFSMAGGEYLGEDKTDWTLAKVMWTASLLGSALPAVAFLAPQPYCWPICAVLVIGMLAVIAYERPEPFWHSLRRTVIVLAVATAFGVGTGLLVGLL